MYFIFAAKALGVERIPLHQLLKESDYVILSCPLTSETKHLINAESLKVMKNNAVIVNIARGGKFNPFTLVKSLFYNCFLYRVHEIMASSVGNFAPTTVDGLVRNA